MRRRSSVNSLPIPKLLGYVFLSFIVGYVVANFFDVNQLSTWVDHMLDREPVSSMARNHSREEKELPKPKFEFYSMLSNDAAARGRVTESAATSGASAPTQPASANTENRTVNANTGAVTATTSTPQTAVAPPIPPKLSAKQAAVLASMSHPIQPVNLSANNISQATPAVSAPQVSLPAVQKPLSATTIAERYFVQVAAFKSPQEGEKIRASLVLKGYSVSIVPVQTDRGQWYRVMAGPYATKDNVLLAKQKITSQLHMIGIIRKEA